MRGVIRMDDDRMRSHIDSLGLLLLYYPHYLRQRCAELHSLFTSYLKYATTPLELNIVQIIVSYTATEIVYMSTQQQLQCLNATLQQMPDLSPAWIEFLYTHVLCKLDGATKRRIKRLSRDWPDHNEWDFWLSTVKNRAHFLCFIDVFEYMCLQRCSQQITTHFMPQNDLEVVQRFMNNENAFQYLELYHLLLQYDLSRNKCVRCVFQKLLDAALSRDRDRKCKTKSDRKHAARKQLNQLYVQFCRQAVSDWQLANNFLLVWKQLLPQNLDNAQSAKKTNSSKKPKKLYRFDFAQAISVCFKSGQLHTLTFLIDNKLLVDVERGLRLFYVDDVMKRIIFGNEPFDEKQEDFLRLILNWTWSFARNKCDMMTWYQKWLEDATIIEDDDCIEILQHYAERSPDSDEDASSPYSYDCNSNMV